MLLLFLLLLLSPLARKLFPYDADDCDDYDDSDDDFDDFAVAAVVVDDADDGDDDIFQCLLNHWQKLCSPGRPVARQVDKLSFPERQSRATR